MSGQSAFDAWLTCIEREQAGILATILQQDANKHATDRIFISGDGMLVGDLGDKAINASVIEIANHKFNEKNPKPETRDFSFANGDEISIFIDVNLPKEELMIFGAGHDAIPVANYSVSLGFRTTIIDSRSHYNNEKRFPGTTRIISRTEDFPQKIQIGNRTYIIVMNHHLERDQETLKFVLHSSAPYIGVLGPHSRRIRMVDALKDEGVLFTKSQLKRMHSPVGLDIGAGSPEEIAISMLAEVIAMIHGHAGGFLRGSEFIHVNGQ